MRDEATLSPGARRSRPRRRRTNGPLRSDLLRVLMALIDYVEGVDLTPEGLAAAIERCRYRQPGSADYFIYVARASVLAMLKPETMWLHEAITVTVRSDNSRGAIDVRIQIAHVFCDGHFFVPPVPSEELIEAQMRVVAFDVLSRIERETWPCVLRGRSRVIAPGFVVADNDGVPLWWTTPSEPCGSSW